jgi:AraC family transcriptional activator of pobA
MDRPALFLYDSNMPARREHRAIPDFSLFGEAGDLPDVVHCETIAARSTLNEWEFAPHRHGRLHQMLLVEKGGGEARFETGTVALAAMTLVNVPTGHVHGFSFVPGTDGFVVTLASEALDELLGGDDALRRALGEAATAPADEETPALMRRIFAEHAGRDFARAQMLKSLTGVLAGRMARALAPTGGGPGAGAATTLFRRFEALVETHYPGHWSVADYAAALAVTPTHLTRLARAATGKPASRLIEERLVREARRHLAFTNLPVATIAYSLGFDDPAYFSRVFARASDGVSPRAFRARTEKGRG